MKRILSILLASLTLLALCACGAEPEASAPEAPAAEAEAEAVETEAAEEAAAVEPIQLVASSPYNPNEAGGLVFGYLCDKIEEYSEGAIEITTYYSGTLCAQSEEWAFLKQGEVDIVCETPNLILSAVPCILGCAVAADDMAAGFNLVYNTYFDGGEVQAAIDAACATYNFKLLGVSTAGNSLLITKDKSVSSWQDVIDGGYVVGTPINNDVYTALGVDNVSAAPGDFYDSLSRGVFNAIGFSAAGYTSVKIYEVAPYACSTNVSSTGPCPAMNLDTFNSLSPELQDAVVRAGADASLYSVELYRAEEDSLNDVCTLTYLNPDDANRFAELLFSNFKIQLRSSAENLGGVNAEAVELVIASFAEQLGYSAD